MKRPFHALTIAGLLLVAAGVLLGPTVRAQAEEKTLISGWYQNRQVKYYDFGTNTPLIGDNGVQTQPIWVFIHGMKADGTPDLVQGQHNIIDIVPGQPGYSDLWQVVFVTVPDDYEADSIRSAQEVQDSGYPTQTTAMFVNCPIVPAGTTLESGKELVQGWNDDEEVFYPDFGANPPMASPIWVLIHGMNADGTPDFVEGQNNIIDDIPGDADYSAFWRVNLVTVPADYEPNSIRSAADVFAAGYEITETDMLVNCPVTEVAAAPSEAPSGVPAAGTGYGGDGGGPATALIATLAGIGAFAVIATGAGFAYSRRRR